MRSVSPIIVPNAASDWCTLPLSSVPILVSLSDVRFNVAPPELIVPGFVRAHGGSDIRDVNLNSENWAVVKAALVAGMYPNLAHIDQEAALLSSSRKKKLHFHPTSVLNQSCFKEVGQSFAPRSCTYRSHSR